MRESVAVATTMLVLWLGGGTAQAGVVVSEVASSAGGTTGGFEEMVELANNGPRSVDIAGWKINLGCAQLYATVKGSPSDPTLLKGHQHFLLAPEHFGLSDQTLFY